jgi:transposase
MAPHSDFCGCLPSETADASQICRLASSVMNHGTEEIMTGREISVKKYVVILNTNERERLHAMLKNGGGSAQQRMRARILLKADVSEAGEGWSDSRIVEALRVSAMTVYRTRQQLVEEGIESVLRRRQRATRIFDAEKKAKLLALACSKPPLGRTKWTMQLLANKVVELRIVTRASDNTISRVLKGAT